MHKPQQIAIILPDTLQRIGLRSLLTDYFPPVEITLFSSFEAFAAGEKDLFDWYFILPEYFVVQSGFFLPERNKTVCILYGAEESPDTTHPDNCLRILATQESIIDHLRHILQGENTSGLQTENGKDLSLREKEVLQGIVTGITNREIADKLFISLNTVLTHRKNITAKLGIKTVPGLTFYAITHGLISGNSLTAANN
jgi:DNA-binding CsgD family transcriptional regulator